MTSLYADDNLNIGFKYGFLGQLKSNPDSIIELSDSSIIHTGDKVQVNVGFLSGSSFLLIFNEFTYILPNSIP